MTTSSRSYSPSWTSSSIVDEVQSNKSKTFHARCTIVMSFIYYNSARSQNHRPFGLVVKRRTRISLLFFCRQLCLQCEDPRFDHGNGLHTYSIFLLPLSPFVCLLIDLNSCSCKFGWSFWPRFKMMVGGGSAVGKTALAKPKLGLRVIFVLEAKGG